jgi:hypothetical protein
VTAQHIPGALGGEADLRNTQSWPSAPSTSPQPNIGPMTSVCQPAVRIASVKLYLSDGIERDRPALGERRPQLFFLGQGEMGDHQCSREL